ncbi:unnamed protein product [Rhizoctonia solani]|uniref:Protein kinase domain-containing protein n=1 Tax=Rhizoctonia solani TaxID=456999 RepID=A0A8H3GW57_9AGAM|nr:unnamed protein product [Rhizoctonia solani]
MDAANPFDRNPLHVVHLQGPVDRLHDTNLRAIYERAGKILLIQRWKDLTTSAPHAFLLFESEQAANSCCNRIGAPRITTPNNSHPQSITASILQPSQPNHPALQQWLNSQNVAPSYVIKSPPSPPKAAGFPLSCLKMLNEDASDVIGKLKEFKCGPGWWRFVAQMYVANKLWAAARMVLKCEKEPNDDVIYISDDSGHSASDDDQSEVSKTQKYSKPRVSHNVWLPSKRDVNGARSKLGVVSVKPEAAALKPVAVPTGNSLCGQTIKPTPQPVNSTLSQPPLSRPIIPILIPPPSTLDKPIPIISRPNSAGPNGEISTVQGLLQVQAAGGSFPSSPATMNTTPPQLAQQSHPQTAFSQSPHLGQSSMSNQNNLDHVQPRTQTQRNPPQPMNYLPTMQQLYNQSQRRQAAHLNQHPQLQQSDPQNQLHLQAQGRSQGSLRAQVIGIKRKAPPGTLTLPPNELTQQANNSNSPQTNGIQGGPVNGTQMNDGSQAMGRLPSSKRARTNSESQLPIETSNTNRDAPYQPQDNYPGPPTENIGALDPNVLNQAKSVQRVRSNEMTPLGMFECLIGHGCFDLRSLVEPNRFSSHRVAEGGFGDIWKGQLTDGTRVAVKVLRYGLIREDGSKSIKRAMREIYNWSKLEHENVHKLLGVTMFQGRLGMVSIWMEHGTLQQYLNQRNDISRHALCLQIAEGVAYLHGVNMIHGDLKASNILMSPEGIPKLTDFDYSIISDCSLVFSATTRMGGGTLRWMAPELVIDEEPVERNKRTDIYALGMTFLVSMVEISPRSPPNYPG